MQKKPISILRKYKVKSVADEKDVAKTFLNAGQKSKLKTIAFGLPELDDRFHIWRVPITLRKKKIGEIVVNARTAEVNKNKSTKLALINRRISESTSQKVLKKKQREKPKKPVRSPLLKNMLILGDSIDELKKLPKESINLVFTSPPYYNAKPEYSEYANYDEYLKIMRKVIRACANVLSEGRFFVLNVSPILLRRASRSESSKRIAVPFDFHSIFIKEGFEFIDDIHWVKPEGVGWAFGRGRRFYADRNPLQYKPVPITEYLLVYRKATDKLIDWNIRQHHSKVDVKESKITDGYETTNLWRINPSSSKVHPATFPIKLAEKVITYYSFKNDVVLDPFGGVGTTAMAASNLGRRFVLVEIENRYIKHMKDWMRSSENVNAKDIEFVNTDPLPSSYKVKINLNDTNNLQTICY